MDRLKLTTLILIGVFSTLASSAQVEYPEIKFDQLSENSDKVLDIFIEKNSNEVFLNPKLYITNIDEAKIEEAKTYKLVPFDTIQEEPTTISESESIDAESDPNNSKQVSFNMQLALGAEHSDFRIKKGSIILGTIHVKIIDAGPQQAHSDQHIDNCSFPNPMFTREIKPADIDKEIPKKHYILTYDFKNDKLYQKNSKCQNRKKFMAKVNETMIFRVININPYKYDVTINSQVINLHTEGATDFQALLPSKKEGEESSAEYYTEGEKEQKGITCEHEKIRILYEELSKFYNDKKSKEYLDLDLLQSEVNYISKRISEEFNISPDKLSKNAILIAGHEIFDENEISDEKIKKEYENYLTEAANYFELINKVNFKISSGPVQVTNDDFIQFNLSIKKGEKEIINQPYKIQVKGGWKLDFSTGLFATGLIDSNYALKDSIIIQDDSGPFRIGLGVLSHFYPRTGARINFGITTGFILDNNFSTQFLLGGSLLFGKEQRFSVTGAIAAGKVKRLASGLTVGQKYQSDSNTIPTKDFWDYGWAFGFSYNFGSVSLGGSKKDTDKNKD